MEERFEFLRHFTSRIVRRKGPTNRGHPGCLQMHLDGALRERRFGDDNIQRLRGIHLRKALGPECCKCVIWITPGINTRLCNVLQILGARRHCSNECLLYIVPVQGGDPIGLLRHPGVRAGHHAHRKRRGSGLVGLVLGGVLDSVERDGLVTVGISAPAASIEAVGDLSGETSHRPPAHIPLASRRIDNLNGLAVRLAGWN